MPIYLYTLSYDTHYTYIYSVIFWLPNRLKRTEMPRFFFPFRPPPFLMSGIILLLVGLVGLVKG